MKPGIFRGTAVFLTCFLLLACGLAVQPRNEFQSVFRDYSERLRWRDYKGVASYLDEAERGAFMDRFADLDDLNIVDVQLESADFQEQDQRVVTTTNVEYYLLPSMTVKKLRLRQQWVYQGADRYHPGVWRLDGPFPPFP